MKKFLFPLIFLLFFVILFSWILSKNYSRKIFIEIKSFQIEVGKIFLKVQIKLKALLKKRI